MAVPDENGEFSAIEMRLHEWPVQIKDQDKRKTYILANYRASTYPDTAKKVFKENRKERARLKAEIEKWKHIRDTQKRGGKKLTEATSDRKSL